MSTFKKIKRFDKLKRGDIVKHKGNGANSYVVTANYGNRVTLVSTKDMTNLSEWMVMKRKYNK